MSANRPKRKTRVPVLMVRLADIRAVTGIAASTFEKFHNAGLVPSPVYVSGCRLWNVCELRAWVNNGCPPRAEWAPIWAESLRQAASKPKK